MRDDTSTADDFRHAMRRFTAAVTVISLAHGGERYGMTATAVTSLSMTPPALLACVNNSGHFYRSLAGATHFCVNVLHRDQTDVSRAFSGALAHAERFAHGRWEADAMAVPFLTNAQANVFCRCVQFVKFATHDIVIGEVYDVRFRRDVNPLLYCDGAYAQTAPVTACEPPSTASAPRRVV